jgi:hypothetical protein
VGIYHDVTIKKMVLPRFNQQTVGYLVDTWWLFEG